MARVLLAIILSTVPFCWTWSQDSFYNPYSFEYLIEYSSEYSDSISSATDSSLEMKYDSKTKVSTCRLRFEGMEKYCGRVLDRRLEKDVQVFVLERYFLNKYNACLQITRKSEDLTDQKIGMIYYANQKEDTAKEKTCYCLLLRDSDITDAIRKQ